MLNHLSLQGRICADPILRYTATGMAVCSVRVASNHTYMKGDEKKEDVLFLDASFFGKTGEALSKFFTKGKEIIVEGRLQLDQWDDKETGQKRQAVKLNGERWHFVSTPKEEGSSQPRQQQMAPAPAPAPAPEPARVRPEDDDLPF